jgi:hypothetical protein
VDEERQRDKQEVRVEHVQQHRPTPERRRFCAGAQDRHGITEYQRGEIPVGRRQAKDHADRDEDHCEQHPGDSQPAQDADVVHVLPPLLPIRAAVTMRSSVCVPRMSIRTAHQRYAAA